MRDLSTWPKYLRRVTRMLIVVAAMAAAPTGAADPVVASSAVRSLEAGVICPPPTVGSVLAPGTVAGTTHIITDEPPFVSPSRSVPAVLGISFGVRVLAADTGGIADVTVVITHPAMGPGKVESQHFGTAISGDSASITFYQFDYAYELIPGTWTMTATTNDSVLYSVTFDVVPPAALPTLAQVCNVQDMLS